MSDDQLEQQELPGFETKAGWFHILKQMIENEDAKKLGGNAFFLYSTIKCYTGGNDGVAYPSIDFLETKTGLARATIIKCQKALEEYGYLKKEKVPSKTGYRNVYKLREKLAITDQDGQVVAHASWDYISQVMPLAIKELKNALITGSSDGLKYVHIERLTINLNQSFDSSTMHNDQRQGGSFVDNPKG